MAKTHKYTGLLYEPSIIQRFPNFEPSPLQKVLLGTTKQAFISMGFMSRQVGKSSAFATSFIDKLMNSKNGEDYAIIGAQEATIKDNIIDDILLEPFGGVAPTKGNINSVYIPTPKTWIERMAPFWSKNPHELKDLKKKRLVLSDGVDDLAYVKLFANDLDVQGAGKSKSNHYVGTLFTGADVIAVGATRTHLGNALRGKKLCGVYFEEIFQYSFDPFGIVAPPIINNDNGWMIGVGTPNEDKPFNWAYQKFYQPLVESNTMNKKVRCGADFYYDNTEYSTEDPRTGELVKTKKLTSVMIGDIERIFPFVYKGTKKFNSVQSQRRYPHKINYFKDANGKNIINPETGIYEYEVIPTGQTNAIASLTEAQYAREYRVRFDAGSEAVFPTFSRKHNIVSYEDIKHKIPLMDLMVGYDHGSESGSNVKIIDMTKGGLKSASCFVLVGMLPITPHKYQYIALEEFYIEDPTDKVIADNMLSFLKNGYPIIYDSALSNKITSNRTPLGFILQSNQELHKNFSINNGLYKSIKTLASTKFNMVRRYFAQDDVFEGSEYIDNFYSEAQRKKMSIPILSLDEEGGRSRRMVVTDRCPNLIEYFSKMIYEKNSKGHRVPAQLRDDSYDAYTYVIDFVEKADQKMKLIRNRFFRNRHLANNNLPTYQYGATLGISGQNRPNVIAKSWRYR